MHTHLMQVLLIAQEWARDQNATRATMDRIFKQMGVGQLDVVALADEQLKRKGGTKVNAGGGGAKHPCKDPTADDLKYLHAFYAPFNDDLALLLGRPGMPPSWSTAT